MKKIAKLLKADLNGSSNLAAIAAMLSSKGRGNDTLLAHITPREAEILKAAGGSGTTNPDTGLLEFFDGEGVDYTYAPDQTAAETARLQNVEDRIQATRYSPETATQEDLSFGPGKVPEGVLIDPNTGQAMPTRYEPSGTSAPTFFRESGIYSPAQGSAQVGVNTQIPSTPYVATSADRAALFGEGGYGAKASPTEIASSAPENFDFLGKLGKIATPEMARLGLAGAGALVGAGTARRAAEAGKAGKAELQTLATPYQQTGTQLQAQAQRGELTPVGQQSLQAMQARLAQGAESRGGVGTAQAAAQLEALRQSLLQQQMDYGLKISGIGDNIAMGAIRTGLQADQAVNQLTNSMYSNMLYLASGMYPGVTRTAERA
jgi:hypothetical protein